MLGAALPGTTPIQAQQTPAANPLDAVPDKMPFDIPYGTPISLERAEAAIAATVAEAKKHDWKLNVAVVDSGGNLGGKLIGAIGCSGATDSQDEVACKVGAATIK